MDEKLSLEEIEVNDLANGKTCCAKSVDQPKSSRLTEEDIMVIDKSYYSRTLSAALIACLLNRATVIAANAPMTVAQVALYQGADREKILIEGAKKEGAFMLYGSHTWYPPWPRSSRKNIHSSK